MLHWKYFALLGIYNITIYIVFEYLQEKMLSHFIIYKFIRIVYMKDHHFDTCLFGA